MEEQKDDIVKDDIVSKIVRDPKRPPRVLLLSGFLGDSSEDGYVRLYFDAQLSDYVEIPEKAILLTKEMPEKQFPLGGRCVWIERDAKVIHGAIGGNRFEAGFLEGRMRQLNMMRAQFGCMAPPAPFPPPRWP